ncbi:molybdopterin molybdotransferase MoeA [Candidatus Chloroploca mongolica]|nr:gephyrin-like molybdotransferase Glp [Candidatus Chloroploca mongolica]
MPESPYPMVSVDEAQQVIMGRVVPLEAEEVDALTADGRVLAQAIQAPLNIPDVPKAAMDGYALRTDDGLKPRRIVAELTAGTAAGVSLEPGTAVRIMTGAPMPAGADAMLPVELAEEHAGWLTLHHTLQSGQHVHTVGQDAAQGATILARGTVIGTPELGLLATFGLTRVQVYRRPRVAVLATGDEVIEPGLPRPAGAVYDSNRYALMAALREAGCEVLSLGIAPDDHTKQREALLRGLEAADVLVTSGGVSMGSRDLIKPLLAELGTVHFGRIAFKPGKPTTFATVGAKLAFGLPGYPVSSLVSCEVFVRPALRALQGDPHPWRPRVRVRLSTPIRPSHDRPEYQRVTIRQEGVHLVAGTTGGQGSSRLMSLLGANGLLLVPPGEAIYPVGTELEALLTASL